MGAELASALVTAFDDANIHPTGNASDSKWHCARLLRCIVVFVFPPRGPNERGPMIWNSNLLSFAGVSQENHIRSKPRGLAIDMIR
jgi:hypothetical protein